MFSAGKDQSKRRRTQNPHDTSVTILTSGCHFSGKLYCRGSSRIGGHIEGQVISEGLLVIEEGALICAEIKAEEVIIQGKVQGRVEATCRVELCSAGRFEGDIATPILVIHEGAKFNGKSSMIENSEQGLPILSGHATEALPNGPLEPTILTTGRKPVDDAPSPH